MSAPDPVAEGRWSMLQRWAADCGRRFAHESTAAAGGGAAVRLCCEPGWIFHVSDGVRYEPVDVTIRTATLHVPTYRDDLPRALHILRGENGGYVVTDAALPCDIVLAAVSDGRELVRWLTEAPAEGGEDAR